jgi:4-amino-4-deoxy-L-arabinose transferase-like glycosyltransferase
MVCQENLLSAENSQRTPFLCRTWVILLLILLLAAFLRLVKLGQISPPGLNQDEAANAWSAYCLLKTGKDYFGNPWPIYYVRNLGGNSPSLYVYLLLPFQAIGGMNIYTTRLPGALGGIFTVWLIYFVGKRAFNTETGLLAAALLAIDPWHLQQSRWGHEVTHAPLLGLAPLALMLWANLPVSDNKTASSRPVVAAVAGALTGIGCFGYMSLRLFVPAFLFTAVLFTLPGWWRTLKTRKGALAVTAFLITFAATFGQLAYLHIFHPEGIGRHASFQPYWVGSVPFPVAIKELTLRYLQHFGLDFLFIKGEDSPLTSPPGMGQLYWYMLPLMLAGLTILLVKFKTSPSARVLLAFIITYPVSDCLGWFFSLSAVRSTPGLCSLILLAAVGAVGIFRWLWTKNRNSTILTTAIFVIAAFVMNIQYLHRFYGKFNRQETTYHLYHTDLIEACEWLKPRLDNFDAVFFTTDYFNMPYVITTVALGYDPKKWFSGPREFTTPGEWDIYTRYGKMYFMYDKLFKLPPDITYYKGKTLFITRPGEINFENIPSKIIHEIVRPDGKVVLLIRQL